MALALGFGLGSASVVHADARPRVLAKQLTGGGARAKVLRQDGAQPTQQGARQAEATEETSAIPEATEESLAAATAAATAVTSAATAAATAAAAAAAAATAAAVAAAAAAVVGRSIDATREATEHSQRSGRDAAWAGGGPPVDVRCEGVAAALESLF